MFQTDCSRPQTRPFVWVAMILALVLAAGGCARTMPKGIVSGRVLLDGKPLPGGEVTFRAVAPNSTPVIVKLDENGAFPAVELPSGEVNVVVDNRKLAPPPPRGPKPIPKGLNAAARAKFTTPANQQHSPSVAAVNGKYVPIPARYINGEATDELKFTVRPGEQKHDIELKS